VGALRSPLVNKGARTLQEKTSKRGAQRALADKIGIDQGYLSKIANAEKIPGLGVRRLLFRELGIPVLDWDEPCEAGGAGPTEAA